MQHTWEFEEARADDQPPYVYQPGGSVVPADGDPDVERYQASQRVRERRRFGSAWRLGTTSISRRRAIRNWAITVAALALIVLFIKPLLVVAAVVAAAVLGIVLLAVLAVGALLLAARFALGGRVAYHSGRSGTFGRTGRWRR